MQHTLLAVLVASVFTTGCAASHGEGAAAPRAHRAVLYQYSVIDGLLAGVYDGDLTMAGLLQHGDFGIGTFNALDGELLLLDGVGYQIRADGSVRVVPDGERSPLGFATFFVPTQTFTLDAAVTLADLQAELVRRLHPNAGYAIELRGRFANLTARSEDPATRPYPEMSAHMAAHEHRFPLTNFDGMAAGFWLPPYLGRVNVPGLHLHCLSSDHRAGGHLLEFQSAGPLTVRVMELDGVELEISKHPDFQTVDLAHDRKRSLEQVEHGAPRQ
jgi:acetolactate decarboxylase